MNNAYSVFLRQQCIRFKIPEGKQTNPTGSRESIQISHLTTGNSVRNRFKDSSMVHVRPWSLRMNL